MAATKRRRFMVNIPPEVAPLVEARAKSLRRSMSNYLEWLVTKDLEGHKVYPENYDSASRDANALAAEPPETYEIAPRVASPAHLRPQTKTVVDKKKVG